MTSKYPPLLLKYLKMYQDDPRSKIFAPLSEAYRKIGLTDEAIEICLEGLAHHPDFIGGKVALARAYFDKEMFAKVKDTIGPIISDIPDNLLAQRLYGDSCLSLGFVAEALSAYKLILYFNPSDSEIINLVQELETQHYESGGLLARKIRPEQLRKLIRLQRALLCVQKAHFN